MSDFKPELLILGVVLHFLRKYQLPIALLIGFGIGLLF